MRGLEERKGDRRSPLQRNRLPSTLMSMDTLQAGIAEPPYSTLPDAEIVRRIQAGDRALFEILMRRHNQRVYRAARAIVSDETEVEDVMQQAYINAFTHLHQFQERSQFSTWLTRIALNEAFGRRRKTRPAEDAEQIMDTITWVQTVVQTFILLLVITTVSLNCMQRLALPRYARLTK